MTTAAPVLWQVRRSLWGHNWWVTEGEWEPGHPELVKARYSTMREALAAAQAHNARLGVNGRPAIPLSEHTVRQAMEENGWRVAPAARSLGITPPTLHNWFRQRFAAMGEEYRPPEGGESRRRRNARRGH